MYKKIRCPKCQFEFSIWIHSLKTDNKPSEVRKMKTLKKKFSSYESARKYIRGKSGEYHIIQMLRDKKGRFEVKKK